METKTPTQSGTMNAALVSALIFGVRAYLAWRHNIEVTGPEAMGLAESLASIWPDLLGLMASVGAWVARLKATRFDSNVLTRKTTWCGIAVGIATIFNALGFDVEVEATQAMAVAAFDIVSEVITSLLTVKIIHGRAKASKKIVIRKAEVA